MTAYIAAVRHPSTDPQQPARQAVTVRLCHFLLALVYAAAAAGCFVRVSLPEAIHRNHPEGPTSL